MMREKSIKPSSQKLIKQLKKYSKNVIDENLFTKRIRNYTSLWETDVYNYILQWEIYAQYTNIKVLN